MAEGKRSFILYCDIASMVEKIPDEAAGKLFKHILDYVNDKNPKDPDDLIVSIAFEPIKQQLKRDLDKYKLIIERNKANGKKGGRPKASGDNNNPDNPMGSLGVKKEPRKADNALDLGNVTGTGNDTNQEQEGRVTKNNFKTSEKVSEVFEYWQETLNHKRSKLGDDKKKVILAALKTGYSVDDLKQAIMGCSKTPHNIGENDRGEKYDQLTLILKNSGQIDRFIGNSASPPTGSNGQKSFNNSNGRQTGGPTEDEWNSTDW